IVATAGFLFIQTEGDFTTSRVAGHGLLRVRRKHDPDSYFTSYLSIESGGNVNLGGRMVTVSADDAVVDIQAASIDVSALITTDAFGEFAGISLTAGSGAITTSGRLRAKGDRPYTAGEIDMYASDITINGPLEIIRNGGIFLTAGGNATLAADARADAT